MHILCEHFFYSVPVQRSSTTATFLPKFNHFILFFMLCTVCFLFQHSLVNVMTNSKVEDLTAELLKTLSVPGMQCYVSGQVATASHFRTLESCYQFLILKFSISSSSCFSVSTLLLCFSADPQVLAVTFTALTQSTALLNYWQDTNI
jgi:hypothetical protein